MFRYLHFVLISFQLSDFWSYTRIDKRYKAVVDDTSINHMTYNYRYLDTQNSVLNKNLMEFYTNKDNLDKIMHIVHGKSRISLRIIDWFVTNYSKKHFVVYDPRTVGSESESGFESGYTRMDNGEMVYDSSGRFKVFNDYKMKLKAYSKKRFDPFCRWTRIQIPCSDSDFKVESDSVASSLGLRSDSPSAVGSTMETTLGQLNFFKWAIENRVLEYIESHYDAIERDMNMRNSNSKRRRSPQSVESRSSDDDAGHIDDFAEIDEGIVATENTFFQEDHATTRKKREELSIYACKCIKKESVKILVKFT